MENYEKIPAVEEDLYGNRRDVLEAHDWDVTVGAAHLLGRAVGTIASNQSRSVVSELFDDKVQNRPLESLQYEMCRNDDDASELERKSALLSAFIRGFEER